MRHTQLHQQLSRHCACPANAAPAVDQNFSAIQQNLPQSRPGAFPKFLKSSIGRLYFINPQRDEKCLFWSWLSFLLSLEDLKFV